MKYHILYNFENSVLFKEKSSDYFKGHYKLKLLTNFEVNLTSFRNNILNFKFVTPHGDEVRLTSKFVGSFSFI